MNFQTELESYIRAGYPILYVTALEPVRASTAIEKVCEGISGGLSCHIWKITNGWDSTDKAMTLMKYFPLSISLRITPLLSFTTTTLS